MSRNNRRQRIEQLIEQIRAEVLETQRYTGLAALSSAVIRALREVPRDAFVPDGIKRYAWDNNALAIGHQQTISQPYIVALMSELLTLTRASKVLEIGTGSGYQCAVLGELAGEVYSMEIIAPLAETAKQRLRELGYTNIHLKQGNGREGWPEHAPFDAIIVTAAAASVPPALIEQLKPGGRMMIPLGSPGLAQELVLITKDARGRTQTRPILPVAFVPLTGEDTP